MEMLVEQISKVEAAELGGQEFQLAVLSALLQVILQLILAAGKNYNFAYDLHHGRTDFQPCSHHHHDQRNCY